MNEKTIICRKLCLKSKFLNKNVRDNILNELNECVKDECTQEHGHIISINKIIKIENLIISRANSDNIFSVVFEASTLKPVVDAKLSGEVVMVYKDGIFISIFNKLQMLIPTMYLEDFTFDEIREEYVGGDRRIKVGDVISAVVTAIEFDKNSFGCFGSLV